MEAILGSGHAVGPWQECARAILIFLYGLVLLRLSGRRTFAQWSALDVVLSIIIGSSLSRALTGSAPLPERLPRVPCSPRCTWSWRMASRGANSFRCWSKAGPSSWEEAGPWITMSASGT